MQQILIAYGPAVASLAAFLAFIFAALGIYVLSIARIESVHRRLKSVREGAQQERSNGFHQEGVFTVRWLQPMGSLILPTDDWRRSILRKQLVVAGFRQQSALHTYLAAKLLFAVLLLVASALALTFSSDQITLAQPEGIFTVVAACVLGFFLPDGYLRARINQRNRSFVEGFPDALDMLVVCVEAGLGLDAAIDRVAQEIRISHPELAIELSLISLEIRAGKSRAEALHSLAERMQVDQVHALTTLLIQAEKYGTSIASALRGFSEEMRVERIQRAKETAAKLPVKLTLPVVFFIFPALFLVVLGPAVVRIYSSILGGNI